MRSNLLSLQNIARQQDIVQNRLATGLKVSSAIDNPSSYYTASSLNNRAADLTALLDSISQGIQTIKAASEAIDSGTKFLEQAKAVANQALETAQPVIARVSNEAELLAAVESGQRGLIVIDGDISLTENQTVKLRDGQSLVGTDGSKLNFTVTQTNLNCITITGNSQLTNLDISITSDQADTYGICNNGGNLKAQNLNFRINSTASLSSVNAFYLQNKSSTVISDQINIKGTGLGIRAILSRYSNVTISENTVFNQVIDGGTVSRGFEIDDESILNIRKNTKINMNIGDARAIYTRDNGVINIDSAFLNLTGNDRNFVGLQTFTDGKINVTGNTVINIAGNGANNKGIAGLEAGKNNITIGGQSRINISMTGIDSAAIYTYKDSAINILNGAIISINNNDPVNDGVWQANTDYRQYAADGNIIGLNSLNSLTEFKALSQPLPAPITVEDIDFSKIKWNSYSLQEKKLKSFNEIINQYDDLISDASYKGINLLNSQRLKINFNEDRSSGIEILGVSALSADLGIITAAWQSKTDIEKSVSELEEAINTLRGYASQYGNYYSIVTTRQNFTENLINVLEEGADKLTLADMNQESANMLALQTSQQLAVNSLSLASQASQAVLRLF